MSSNTLRMQEEVEGLPGISRRQNAVALVLVTLFIAGLMGYAYFFAPLN